MYNQGRHHCHHHQISELSDLFLKARLRGGSLLDLLLQTGHSCICFPLHHLCRQTTEAVVAWQNDRIGPGRQDRRDPLKILKWSWKQTRQTTKTGRKSSVEVTWSYFYFYFYTFVFPKACVWLAAAGRVGIKVFCLVAVLFMLKLWVSLKVNFIVCLSLLLVFEEQCWFPLCQVRKKADLCHTISQDQMHPTNRGWGNHSTKCTLKYQKYCRCRIALLVSLLLMPECVSSIYMMQQEQILTS